MLAIVFAAGTGIAYWHWQQVPEMKDRINFIAAVAGTVAVFYALALNARAMLENAEAQRTVHAMRFVERWSADDFAECRNALGRLRRGKNEEDPTSLISSLNSSSKTNLVNLTNYFEQMAISVEMKIVDEVLLRRFLEAIVTEGYPLLEPWIKEVRRKTNPGAFAAFERVSDRWRKKQESRPEKWGFPAFH